MIEKVSSEGAELPIMNSYFSSEESGLYKLICILFVYLKRNLLFIIAAG
jgi:hypothetical protein